MVLLKYSLLILFAILNNFCFSEASKKVRYIDLNRESPYDVDHYLQPVDKTAFSINRNVSLFQFGFPKFFGYENGKEVNVSDIEANITIFEINQFTETRKIVFKTKAIINSTENIRITLDASVPLKADIFLYEIVLTTPENENLIFKNVGRSRIHDMTEKLNDLNEKLGVDLPKKPDTFLKRLKHIFSLKPTFYAEFVQRNQDVKPTIVDNTHFSVSHGAVKNFTFKLPDIEVDETEM